MSNKKVFGIITVVVVVAVLAYAGSGFSGTGTLKSSDFPVSSVERRSLRITLVEEGTLQPYNYDKIKIDTEEVSEFQVQKVISNGTTVEKGEVILRLDDSKIEQKIDETKQELESAKNDLLYEKEERKKEVLDARLDIRDAKYELELARKNLKKFLNMEHERNLKEKKMSVKQAKVKIDEKQEEYEAAQKMKNKDLVSKSKLEKARVELENAKFRLEKAKMELEIYKNHTFPIKKTELKNKVKSKEEKLKSKKSFFEAIKSQKESDVQDVQSKKQNIEEKLQQLKEDRKNLVVEAPSSGIVNYGNPEGGRFGRDDTELKEGATVRAGRILMYIPDLNNMYVHLPINETDISKLLKTKEESEEAPEPSIDLKNIDRKTLMSAFRNAGREKVKTLSKNLDQSLQELDLSNLDDLSDEDRKTLKSFMKEHLDLRSRRFKRLDATVTSESFPNTEITGEVDYVAGAASEESFWSDVKQFDTKIKLDQHYDWYRPGMNVKVEILIEETDEIRTVPVQAIFSDEGELYSFRKTGNGTFERVQVETDRSNGEFVEITDGSLEEGDRVALSRPDESMIVKTK